ncbi:MAG: hypothetical protein ACKV2T_10555 [Kofleriaceae bacterium]
MLARDEVVGLLIAAVVGAAAIATYVYRQGKASAPAPPVAATPAPTNDQAARDDFASMLADVFEQDQNPATITADGTTLKIKWEMCSKQMLGRLLRADNYYVVQNVRQLSGISPARLKSHGFTRIECDDGRKGLAPAVEKL